MNQFTISLEELIFCFYSEGFFEQGMSLKQAYFPEVEDEQLDFYLKRPAVRFWRRMLLNIGIINTG